MARPEPFRTLLEEARISEPSSPSMRVTTSKPAPRPVAPPPSLEKRLDQALLAGVTPPRGLRAQSVPLRLQPKANLEPLPPPPKPVTLVPTSSPTGALLGDLEATRQLDRSAAVDAALQDAMAAAEATREIPAQRNSPLRPATVTGIAPIAPIAPIVPVPTVSVPKLAAMPELEQLKPPPLPKRKQPLPPHVIPQQAPRAIASPPPMLTAPAPKILGVLGDDATIPGLSPVSSGNGHAISQADLYRLQLEFEDTPARPLPAFASLIPMPVLVPVAAPAFTDGDDGEQRLGGVYSTDLNRLEELEGIEDLDALAQAMGLKSMDVSIPDGLPLGDESLPPRSPSDVRRARVHAALGDGAESVFLDDTIEGQPMVMSRPPLPARPASPVIVRIPARPKVSAEARARARKLYLSAVDELTKGDRAGAIGHLNLAIHYDDGVPLYQDFLKQLTKARSDECEITDSSKRRRRARIDPTIRE